MVKNGNRVVFDEDSQGRDISCITHKATGQKLNLRKENGVYVLDVLVAPPEYKESLKKADEQMWWSASGGFPRQGR